LATTRARAAAASGEKKPARKTARKTAAPRKKAAPRGTARETAGALPDPLPELLAGVAARLDAIEARLATSQAAEPATDSRAAAPEDLPAVTRRLADALAEVPRAADFEPLAEHIYELARHAPRLLEALEAVPAAIAPFQQSVASLRETADTLHYVHESFAESLLRLPRAEDYEPLARPLAEFARVSPALAESLADVLRVTAPLGEAVAGLRRVTEELGATRDALGGRGHPGPRPGAETLAVLESSAAELENARAALQAALDSLPRDPEYKRVAEQLREIASVSPSLMEWMQQVTPLSQPLGESVSALRETAGRLEVAHGRLLELAARLRG
jgi:DNA repair ATPase RecN